MIETKDRVRGIYSITNELNGKIYVGSSINMAKRWHGHRSALRKGTQRSKGMQEDYDRCGLEVFIFQVLELVEDDEDLLEREQFWMDKTKCYEEGLGYNASPTAGSSAGVVHTEKSLKNFSLAQKGKKMSESYRRQLSERMKGENHFNYGKKYSPELRKKLSEAHAGIMQKDETKAKISRTIKKSGIRKGSGNGRAIINEEQAKEIKQLLKQGVKIIEIAERYGVSRQLVSSIKNGRRWTHV